MGLSTILICAVLVVSVTSDTQVPDQIDWRENDAVTKVKDQGSCEGSFYFASLGVIESHYYLSTGKVLDLSEQSAIDCSPGYNNGCEGGQVMSTLDFVRQMGIDTEDQYPYTGELEDCKMDSNQSLFKTMGFKVLPRDEDVIKTVVGTIGPVAITFDGTNLKTYTEGLYSDPSCDSNIDPDFAYNGIIVGYGTTSDGEDYWIVKMSYGAEWGEDGYVRIPRNTGDPCGITQNAIYPLL